MAQIDEILKSVLPAWKPAERMNLSDWADEYAFLSAESSAQEGQWRTLPYQKPIMDAMTDPQYDMIVVKKSARVGYTKMLNHLIAYHIHQDPCSIMMVQPTVEDAEGYSKEELGPMFRDTPCLKGIVSDESSKKSNNTILSKSYPGGTLGIVGANSPRGFRRVSRRVVVFDEIDGYPASAGKEGDQIKLGIRRAEYYWNRKIVMGSTPTTLGHSKIDSQFEKTDMRMLFVPCPGCGHMQTLKWSGFEWPKRRPQDAKYKCESCERLIDNSEKYGMIEKGEYRATQESVRAGSIGFFVWAAYSYSPNANWGDLACEFVDASKDPLTLQTFINTVLGESYEEKGQRVEHTGLMTRCEPMSREILPTGCCVITIGVDVQADRIELEHIGWGRGEESWSLDYTVLRGDPMLDQVWQMLDVEIQRIFVHQSGIQVRAVRTYVDSSNGLHMSRIYDYCRPRSAMNVFACKGSSQARDAICSEKSFQKKYSIDLYMIGTIAAKDLIYGRLSLPNPGPGYCHFPIGRDPEYFKMLTSEEVKIKKGVRRYEKIRPRNEALDCRVYGLAALYALGIKIDDIANAMESPIATPRKREFRET